VLTGKITNKNISQISQKDINVKII